MFNLKDELLAIFSTFWSRRLLVSSASVCSLSSLLSWLSNDSTIYHFFTLHFSLDRASLNTLLSYSVVVLHHLRIMQAAKVILQHTLRINGDFATYMINSVKVFQLYLFNYLIHYNLCYHVQLLAIVKLHRVFSSN